MVIMKRIIIRLIVALISLTIVFMWTGLYEELDNIYVYSSAIGFICGFTAGSPKRGVISGIIWWLVIPLFLKAWMYENIGLLTIYKEFFTQLIPAIMIISSAIFGGTICKVLKL